jgi:hypothetical protein
MIWKWIGYILVCVWLGIFTGYALGYLIADFARDYVAWWYPPYDGELSMSPMQVAQGRCMGYGSVFGLVAGVSVVFADAYHRVGTCKESQVNSVPH